MLVLFFDAYIYYSKDLVACLIEVKRWFLWSVLGIELLVACQGIEFLRPLRTTTPLEKVYDLVRSVVK